MKYFEKYFADVDFSGGAEEVKVLCPFHHDTNPSATVNVEKSLFHCWVCGIGYNEAQFIAKVSNISLGDAIRVLDKFKENQTQADWHLTEKAYLWSNKAFLEKVRELGFEDNIIDSLDLGMTTDEQGRQYLGIPVFFNNVLMDVRSYNLLKHKNVAKCRSKTNAQAGFIIPYDIWSKNKDKTYILEGEKDMILARSLGINAITFTGGAGAKPNEFVINSFKDREVVICYDNDKAGHDGMANLYSILKKVAKSVKYIDIGEVVKEEKEDFYDFIVKYNKNEWDFYALPEYNFTIEVKKSYITIQKALHDSTFRKKLLSKVMINAEFEDTYACPKYVVAEKGKETGTKTEMMHEGEVRNWALSEDNIHQLVELVEVGADKKTITTRLRGYMDITPTEENVSLTVKEYATIYKVKAIDINDIVINNNENDDDMKTMSVDLYSFTPFLVGNQYEIEYKLIPHPVKNQKLIGVAISAISVNDEKDFTPNVDKLKMISGTIEERLQKLYQSAKHHIAKHLSYPLWLMSDLVMNSIYEFKYDDVLRGTLDVFILGDTQVGKSETTSKLVTLYNFGHFLSLKTSTTIGLIGGSNKVDGSWLNTIGAIPRQHKKLVVMEEFSGAKPDFIKTMTDIRSSGMLRFARAAGEMNVPCRLRMITISNPINDEQGNPRHLSTFPNGITPLMELIKSAEDVARYDGFLLVPKPTTRFNPFSYKLEGEPLPKEYYEHKAQWVYSRKIDDVVFEDDVKSYIWEKAEELNKMFECNFPLFTTTSSLKLARFCVAMASLVNNTNETYEKVIVSKEVVDITYNFLVSVYDNPVFKLKEYKSEYDSYNNINVVEIKDIQSLYNRNSTMFDFLSNQATTSRGNLRSISGLDGDAFNPIFNKLVKHKIIRLSGEKVFITEKFRLAMEKVNKNVKLDVEGSLINKVIEGKD